MHLETRIHLEIMKITDCTTDEVWSLAYTSEMKQMYCSETRIHLETMDCTMDELSNLVNI
jgi:hypothetical protein